MILLPRYNSKHSASDLFSICTSQLQATVSCDTNTTTSCKNTMTRQRSVFGNSYARRICTYATTSYYRKTHTISQKMWVYNNRRWKEIARFGMTYNQSTNWWRYLILVWSTMVRSRASHDLFVWSLVGRICPPRPISPRNTISFGNIFPLYWE